MAALSAAVSGRSTLRRERVVRGRDLPLRQHPRRHRRQVALPGRVGRGPDLEVREVRRADQVVQRELALLHAALQVVHDERGLLHVLDVELGLRARDDEAQVEPLALRDVDVAREALSVVDLPVRARVQDRRVLHRVRIAGLVLAQVHPFAIRALVGQAELEAEEPADGGRRDVHVDDGIAHLEVLQDRGAPVEEQALAAEIVRELRLALQVPARRVGRNGDRLGVRNGRAEQGEGAAGKTMAHGEPPHMY